MTTSHYQHSAEDTKEKEWCWRPKEWYMRTKRCKWDGYKTTAPLLGETMLWGRGSDYRAQLGPPARAQQH